MKHPDRMPQVVAGSTDSGSDELHAGGHRFVIHGRVAE
jgi:hypothetical protein